MYRSAVLIRPVLILAIGLVLGLGSMPTASASSNYQYPDSGGIQITRVAQPTCERPRARVYGYATAGGRTASVVVRRSVARNLWIREDTTPMLRKGETFVLVTEPFKKGASKLANVSSIPRGGYFDSEVSSMQITRPSLATCGT